MNETGQAAVISVNKGVQVHGITNRLSQAGVKTLFIGTDPVALAEAKARTGVYIIVIQNDIGEMSHLFKSLLSVTAQDNTTLVVIGGKPDQTELSKLYPELAGNVLRWFDHDVDLEELISFTKKFLAGEVRKDEKKRILIVDDDPTYAKMVREWLKSNYQVAVVVNAMQAITYLTKHGADLILLDYEMPVVSGPQVLEMLRNEPETAKIPVVFLTGVGDSESVSRVIALKPSGYILKSTTREAIISWLYLFFHK